MPSPAFPLSDNDLEHLVSYKFNGGDLGISTVSKVDLPAGSLFTPITTHTYVSKPEWSSVQTGREEHIELNSGLLYINHSCQPVLEVDTTKMEVRVANNRDLKAGDDLSFFYPSTEWYCARPFECRCGAGEDVCIGTQQGAYFLSKDKLDQYFINKHILELAAERDAGKEEGSAQVGSGSVANGAAQH